MPPALDTAAQSFGLHSHIMAPQMMGYLIPNISVMGPEHGCLPLCHSSTERAGPFKRARKSRVPRINTAARICREAEDNRRFPGLRERPRPAARVEAPRGFIRTFRFPGFCAIDTGIDRT